MGKYKVTDPSQVPRGMTDREEAEFWSTHETTKEYLDKIEGTFDTNLPRSKSISVRFDEDTLQRLKKLASQRSKRYQTLLKEFVVERLYEEEQEQRTPFGLHAWLPHGSYVLHTVQSGANSAIVTVTRPEYTDVRSKRLICDGGVNATVGSIASSGEESVGALGGANAGMVANLIDNRSYFRLNVEDCQLAKRDAGRRSDRVALHGPS